MMRRSIRALDAYLRRRQGIRELSDDPDCLFRIRLGRADDSLHRATGRRVAAGARIVELHLRNESLPPLALSGPTLGWAVAARRRLRVSLRALARRILEDPGLADVAAVTGVTAFLTPADTAAWPRLIGRLGFRWQPHRGPLRAWGEFWAKVYAWLLLWTFNAASLRGRRFSRLQRIVVWMPAEELLRRYGDAALHVPGVRRAGNETY